MVLTQRGRFAGPGAPESRAVHLPLLLGRCCASGASSKLAWKCHLIILKTSQQSHGGRGRSGGTLLKKLRRRKKEEKTEGFLGNEAILKKDGIVDGEVTEVLLLAQAGGGPGEDWVPASSSGSGGTVGGAGGGGHSLQSNSPEEELHPAPDQPNSGQLGSPPLPGGWKVSIPQC